MRVSDNGGRKDKDKMRIIYRKDIQVYKVLSGQYRAYVKGEANLEAWGYNEESAILNLGKVLDKKTSYGFELFS